MEETTQNTPSGGANKMSFLAVAVVALLLLGGVAFFMTQNSVKNSQNNAMQPTSAMMEEKNESSSQEKAESGKGATSVKPSGAAMEEGAVKEFTVTAKNFSFAPEEIKVKKGDKVKIVLKNSGGFHDWIIDEFNARSKRISADQTDTVEFTADKVGTFEYYCSVGTHRQMGMKGSLIVE